MINISCKEIPKYIDISLVRTDVSDKEIELLIEMAKKYKFICIFVMPCFTKELCERLKGSNVLVGGVAGFPSGGDLTEIKVANSIKMKEFGCDEIDMVINVGALKSGDYDVVKNDIKAVVDAVYPTPVKSILEIAYLTDEEIAKGCELAVEAGVTFVKSGTGWAQKPTTVHTIEVMANAVQGKAKIKAAGGIRTLEDLETMFAAGCTRFGISLKSALSILKSAYEREGLAFEDNAILENFDEMIVSY